MSFRIEIVGVFLTNDVLACDAKSTLMRSRGGARREPTSVPDLWVPPPASPSAERLVLYQNQPPPCEVGIRAFSPAISPASIFVKPKHFLPRSSIFSFRSAIALSCEARRLSIVAN